MICPACARAAAFAQEIDPIEDETRDHDPSICRDYGRTPDGCGCAHQPVGTATTRQES